MTEAAYLLFYELRGRKKHHNLESIVEELKLKVEPVVEPRSSFRSYPYSNFSSSSYTYSGSPGASSRYVPPADPISYALPFSSSGPGSSPHTLNSPAASRDEPIVSDDEIGPTPITPFLSSRPSSPAGSQKVLPSPGRASAVVGFEFTREPKVAKSYLADLDSLPDTDQDADAPGATGPPTPVHDIVLDDDDGDVSMAAASGDVTVDPPGLFETPSSVDRDPMATDEWGGLE
ncbi:hypothetical protein HK405_013775 [Cladochytrium tenue]|nr:hypothetical protein HK405_013775 [Cladochytrium tenue]